jgi:hypothetical protein
MQIMCLVLCFILDRSWASNQGYGTYIEENPSTFGLQVGDYDCYQIARFFMGCLLLEHIMSYSFGMYRSWEIKHRGVVDSKGFDSAPVE